MTSKRVMPARPATKNARKPTDAELQRQREDRLKMTLARSARVIVVDDVAEGSRATVKRARIADPLDRLDLERPLRHAAEVFRQAYEHLSAGRSLGPMPWAKDRVDESRSSGEATVLTATSAALWYRRGVQAMGLAASQGVVQWVVIRGLPLKAYDASQSWRKGRGKIELVGALTRLADVYFPPVGSTAQTGLTSGAHFEHKSP